MNSLRRMPRWVAVSGMLFRLGGCLVVGLSALVLPGCASGPQEGWGGVRGVDGPPSGSSPDPLQTPDATPRAEAFLSGGANKPYEVGGRSYVPITLDVSMSEHGLASWYGSRYHGRPTASGENYDMHAMTAAHPTMPIPSYARVTNPSNGRSVLVRVNDRGPFSTGRIIDLSWAAAVKLGVQNGLAVVDVQRLTFADIRAQLAVISAPMGTVPPPSVVEASAEKPPETPAVMARPVRPAAEVVALPLGGPAAPTAPGPAAGDTVVRPAPVSSSPPASSTCWLQLGAFSQAPGASAQKRVAAKRLVALVPSVSVFQDAGLYRVQAGPYPSRERAAEALPRVRTALGVRPLVACRAASPSLPTIR